MALQRSFHISMVVGISLTFYSRKVRGKNERESLNFKTDLIFYGERGSAV
jgi:hypothetical protein